jgi:hypothetical protein
MEKLAMWGGGWAFNEKDNLLLDQHRGRSCILGLVCSAYSWLETY